MDGKKMKLIDIFNNWDNFKNALVFANECEEVMEVTLENTDGIRFILLKTQIDNYEGKVIYDIKRDIMMSH